MIRCSKREHTFVTGPDAIELGEQLVDDVTAGAMAQLATFEADGVEFIKEEDARSVAPGRLEQLVEVPLALSQPHAQHISQADRDEAGPHLPRDRAGEKRLAATGRPVKQQTTAQRFSKCLPQLGIAQRTEKGNSDAAFDVLHAADIVQRHLRRQHLPPR